MSRIVNSPSQLSVILKATRKARGQTQARLGERIGVSQNRVSELEADTGTLTVDRLLALLHELGLEMIVRESARDTIPVAPPARRKKAGPRDTDW
jgi:HTH-type transcriptional regulator/antitoxin HipB